MSDRPLRHQVVRTRGGALAMRCLATGEVMHPGVGPRVEAEALYVRQSRLSERLAAADPSPLVLFDVGLGAGSNALAARAASQAAPLTARRLVIVSFERDLGALALALAHGPDFGYDGENAEAVRAVLAHGHHETARTSWRIEAGDLPGSLAREVTRAEIVFWDPFSPRNNPDLWTVAAFAAIRAAAAPACTLFTYSSSTATRAAMLLAGWAVGIGDPIGDKAETTAAAVNVADLARPLPPTWLSRVRRPDARLPSDAPPDAADCISRSPQFLAPPA
jgi:queuine tRNA-ribosyltransferase